MEHSDYKPIDCAIYDHYIIWCDRKLKVIFTSTDNSFLAYESEIKDLITKEKIEYVISGKDIWHRLDRVILSLK